MDVVNQPIEAAAGLIPLENGSSTISGQLIRDSEGRRGRTQFRPMFAR